MTSAKKCDNLLVERDIFAILGVSFCVAQNDFNFIKKKEHKGTVQQVLYSHMSYFSKLMELFPMFASHKKILIATATLSFLMVAG